MAYSHLIILLCLTMTRVYADDPLGHECHPTGVGPSASFTSNLNKLMRKFQVGLPPLHYYQDQVTGPGNNNVYGFILCRGDTTIPECKACVSSAVTELMKQCSKAREASIWYDKCMIKYADLPFFGEIDHRDDFYLWDPKEVPDKSEFNKKTKGLLSGLIPTCVKASNRFARGTTPFGGRTIYGMVQCSRDLSPDNCGKCLSFQIDDLGSECCDGTEGGRVVGNSCNIRYEMYPFLKN